MSPIEERFSRLFLSMEREERESHNKDHTGTFNQQLFEVSDIKELADENENVEIESNHNNDIEPQIEIFEDFDYLKRIPLQVRMTTTGKV